MSLLVECIWCKTLTNKKNIYAISYIDAETKKKRITYACKVCTRIVKNDQLIIEKNNVK
jgi:hypothetical protein